MGPAKSPQAGRTRRRSEKEHVEALLDEALDETFPASDPIAVDPVQSHDRKANVGGFEPKITNENVRLKRAYESASRADGRRVLIDRLWPRGVKKAQAKIDTWMKEIAPSAELRKWFAHDPDRWVEFQARYKEELKEHADDIARLRAIAKDGRLTLVFAARDKSHNDAVVLRDLILRTK